MAGDLDESLLDQDVSMLLENVTNVKSEAAMSSNGASVEKEPVNFVSKLRVVAIRLFAIVIFCGVGSSFIITFNAIGSEAPILTLTQPEGYSFIGTLCRIAGL
jgi:hypothetical protein